MSQMLARAFDGKEETWDSVETRRDRLVPVGQAVTPQWVRVESDTWRTGSKTRQVERCNGTWTCRPFHGYQLGSDESRAIACKDRGEELVGEQLFQVHRDGSQCSKP
jgi:hypothetical protein